MIQTMSEHICCFMMKRQVIDGEYIEVYRYGFECMIASLVQSLVLFAICWFWGALFHGILFTVCFGSLKRWAGGYHAPSHTTCFLLFTAMAVVSCFAAIRISEMSFRTYGQAAFPVCLFLALSFAAVFTRAPVPHPNNPKTAVRIRKCRKMARLTVAVHVFAITAVLFFTENHLSHCLSGSLGTVLAAVTMYIPNKERRGTK